MRRIILSGCNGSMGQVVSQAVLDRHDCVIISGFDINTKMASDYDYRVFSDPSEFVGNADVIIDFSSPVFLPKLLAFATTRKIPTVIATTGLNPAQIEQLRETSLTVPIFFSANMSLGVNLIVELTKKAAAVLGDSFDIEIIEMHHNQKLDAPSGTALMIADSISNVLPQEPQYIYDRHSVRRRREKKEIGIHSVRGGTIVGEHEVIFAGKDEVITIRHSAMSKQVFATGAINAALFLCNQKPGLYNMGDLVASK
jgi:4-hydroxy-tetrahydrodipicolinate reductase